MPVSNFPHGFAHGVSISGIPRLDLFSGNVFWVDSVTGSDTTGSGTNKRPFATIDYAVGMCTASKGDVILVREGHVETVSAAAGIAFDVAGITVIGLGNGSQRPRVTLGTLTSASVTVSATGITVQNIVFSAALADIVTCFNITAKDASIIGCEFVESAVDLNFLTPIKATSTSNNNADGLRVYGCKWLGVDVNSLEFIEINANLDRCSICYNHVTQFASTATPLILVAGTKVLSGADIGWNRLQNGMTTGSLFISNGGSTGQYGMIYNNYCANLDVTGAQDLGAATGIQFFGNLMTSTSVASGALVPVADTPLS